MPKKKTKTSLILFVTRHWGWRRAWERNTSRLMMNPPVLLDIFLDAALWFDEREGRFAITFRRHDNNLLCVFKIKYLKFRDFFFASTNDGPAHLVRHYDVLIYHKKKQKCINHQVTPFCCVCVHFSKKTWRRIFFFPTGRIINYLKASPDDGSIPSSLNP